MNSIDDNLPTLDDERFDLLADGELSESERRNLLSTLDDLPGGWRRCALAFLEAQSWKDEIRAIRRESVAPPQTARRVGRHRFPRGAWVTMLAVAASLLIAFGLSVVMQGAWRPGAGAGPSPSEIAQAPKSPEGPAPNPDEPGTLPAPGDSADSWQLVTLPVRAGPSGAESIRLPARQMDRIDDEWLAESAPTVPDDLLEALQQSGHEVGRHRSWLRFPMQDGRQLVVPYEQVEFHYVPSPSYQ